jgi:hypothetical protein
LKPTAIRLLVNPYKTTATRLSPAVPSRVYSASTAVGQGSTLTGSNSSRLSTCSRWSVRASRLNVAWWLSQMMPTMRKDIR